MQILHSKPLVEQIKAELKSSCAQFEVRSGSKPKLAVILVGEDPASVIYTSRKSQLAEEVGMAHITMKFPVDAKPEEVKIVINQLNADPSIHGILMQRPLPRAYKESEVLQWIHPSKDVDAFHPLNTGHLQLGLPCFAPCTPAGVMEILKYYQIAIEGKVAAVIGRSSIVGKPMATLLLQANATVIHCHSQTQNLPSLTTLADILVVAAGKPGLIGRDHIKPGAVVVDVGIHRNANGTVIGDVRAAEAEAVASAMTPVPGGVGPMTIAILLKNTLRAAELSFASRPAFRR